MRPSRCFVAIGFLIATACAKSQSGGRARANEDKTQEAAIPPTKRIQVSSVMGVDLATVAKDITKTVPGTECSGWGTDGLVVSGVELVSSNCHRKVNKGKEVDQKYYFLNDPKLAALNGRLAKIEITLGSVKTAEAAAGVLDELKAQFGEMTEVTHEEPSRTKQKHANYMARFMGYGQATIHASEEPAKGTVIEHCPKTSLACDAWSVVFLKDDDTIYPDVGRMLPGEYMIRVTNTSLMGQAEQEIARAEREAGKEQVKGLLK